MSKQRTGAVAILFAAAACGGKESPALATLADSASYAVGMNMGHSLQEVREDVNLEQVIQGLRDLAEKKDGRLTPADAQRVIQAYGGELQQKHAERQKAQADSNKIAGDAYRAENAKHEGVQSTASGLQYEVLTEGSGPHPAPTDIVHVHYRGTLIDGKVFDDSYSRGQPETFQVDAVVPGWSEALQLMSVGSKYRVVIPPELAYGVMGSPPDIGPNATLVFEMELISIGQ
jgi:FKBP-type peptidyl-prolyl cis-trans isomerase